MRMGRRGAVALLVVAVLWAAMPALACLTRLERPSCCQGMEMAECNSPAMMQCGDCCSVRPADVPLLPGSAGAVDRVVGSVASAAPFAIALPPAAANLISPASETWLPPGSPGVVSVLRI